MNSISRIAGQRDGWGSLTAMMVQILSDSDSRLV